MSKEREYQYREFEYLLEEWSNAKNEYDKRVCLMKLRLNLKQPNPDKTSDFDI